MVARMTSETPKRGGKQPRPADILAAVGRRLYAARMELDPNRTRFSASFGILHTLWHKWEKGENYPDPYTMTRLCERYGLTMEYLYRGILRNMPNEELKLRLARKLRAEDLEDLADTARPAGIAASGLASSPAPSENKRAGARRSGRAKAQA